MSNITSQVKMRLFNNVWITTVDYIGVEFVSMASDIRDSLRGLQDSIHYTEQGVGRMLTHTDKR